MVPVGKLAGLRLGKGRKKTMAQLEGSQAEGILSYCAILFYSGLQLTGWGPPILGGNLLSQLIQMLILPSNTLTDTQVGLVKLTHKINHHT